MKQFKTLTDELKALEAFHKKVIEDQSKGEPTKPLPLKVNEAYEEGHDLFVFITTNSPVGKKAKALKSKKIADWIKIAELGAKDFAKQAKLPKDWDMFFSKKVRASAAKKLMDKYTK